MPKTPAKAKSDAKFNKKTYERIAFELRYNAALNGNVLRTHATAVEESVNGFIKRAIAETMRRDL